MEKELEKEVYDVYFITDRYVSVLYSGQDTGENFGTHCGAKQLPKDLIVCKIKNINTYLNDRNVECTDCELFMNGTWKAWSTKREYIDAAIKFYKEVNYVQ